MKNIWKDKKAISQKLITSKGFLIFLDFDGTLSPIVSDFKNANIDPEIKNILKKIILLDNVFVMIVSGRKLEGLKEKINLPGLNYAGNHGLEWIINGVYDRFPIGEKITNSLNEVKKIYYQLSEKYEGIFVEDKSMSISIHYRSLEKSREAEFKKDFYRLVKDTKEEKIIEFVEGKKVIDARPKIDWNKGQIIEIVTQQIPGKLAIAIGDDTTDEDMFGKITKGLTIRVGESGQSKAEYFLDSIDDVNRFLNYLHEEIIKNPLQQKIGE